MKQIQNKLKKIIKYIVTYLVIIILFILLLLLASSFSSKCIKEKTKESADILLDEGNAKQEYIFHRGYILEFDNFTDSLMINNAYSIDSNEAFKSAMLVRKNYIPGVTKKENTDTRGDLVSAGKYEEYDTGMELYDTVNENVEESFEYARYWHGYIVFLRILLLFFNVTQIRIIFKIIFLILALIMFYLIAKKLDLKTAIFFEISLISIEYFYIGESLQGISVFLISMVFSIIVLLKDARFKNVGLSFFIVACLTNYFDFLTQPLVTLGIPLIVYFLIKQKQEKTTIKESILFIIKISFIWIIGYVITWATKWIIVDLFYNRNLIEIGLSQGMYRTGWKLDIMIESITVNLDYEKNIISFLIVAKIINIIIRYFLINPTKKKRYNIEELIPYAIIGMMPIMWYIVFSRTFYKTPLLYI